MSRGLTFVVELKLNIIIFSCLKLQFQYINQSILKFFWNAKSKSIFLCYIDIFIKNRYFYEKSILLWKIDVFMKYRYFYEKSIFYENRYFYEISIFLWNNDIFMKKYIFMRNFKSTFLVQFSSRIQNFSSNLNNILIGIKKIQH